VTKEADVVISRKALSAYILFLLKCPGAPTGQDGRIHYPGPLGMIAFLNHFEAPAHVEAAVVLVSAELAGQRMLADEKLLKNELHIKTLCHKAVALARQVGPNVPHVGKSTFTPYLHRICQVLEAEIRTEAVLVICALIWQLCEQIRHAVDVFEEANPGWRDLMMTIIESLDKHDHPATDLVSEQVLQLLEPGTDQELASAAR
jgi:hypothetical protein